MKDQGQQGDRNSVFIIVPDKIGRESKSIRYFEATGRDGKPRELAEVTLPHGTYVNGRDASFHSFIVSAKQVDPGGLRGSRSHSILVPETSRTSGEPWNIKLKRDFGSRDESGRWVSDVHVIDCSSSQLKQAMRDQFEAYKASSSARSAERSAERSAAAEQEEPAADLERDARESAAVAASSGRDARQAELPSIADLYGEDIPF